MVFNSYVISLASEKRRRESINKQLQEKNINFEFIEATDLRNDKSYEYKNIHSSPVSSIQRIMTKAEIGCSLSHLKTYKKIQSNKWKWSLILEDDANLIRLNKQNLIDIMTNVSASIDVIILGYSKLPIDKELSFYIKEPITPEIKINNTKLGQPWKNWTSGTVGYLITKNGAKKILQDYISNNKKVQTVADDWNYFSKVCGLKIYHCRPLLVFENFENFESSIELERSKVTAAPRMKIYEFLRYIRGFFRKLIMTIRK